MIRSKEEIIEVIKTQGTYGMTDDEVAHYILVEPDPEINRLVDEEEAKYVSHYGWKEKLKTKLHFLVHGRRLKKRVFKSIDELYKDKD